MIRIELPAPLRVDAEVVEVRDEGGENRRLVVRVVASHEGEDGAGIDEDAWRLQRRARSSSGSGTASPGSAHDILVR